MMTTDPIADMLTRIRNANKENHKTVDVPSSKMKKNIANILLEEGFISKIEEIEEGIKKTMRLSLKYVNKTKVISGLKRISTPGLRIFVNSEELPQVLNGLGIAIISTSKGVMTDKKARKLNIGGEVIAYIW